MSKELRALVRNVVDFPKTGIVFRDITPLLADSAGLAEAMRAMAAPYKQLKIDVVVGAESRGFIFGTAIALELGCGFVPVRKPGKLPSATISKEYGLEYGTDNLEIHTDAIKPGQAVLMADDLLATGGTMKACCDMVEQLGGKIAAITFLIELSFLGGRKVLGDYPIHSVIDYDHE